MTPAYGATRGTVNADGRSRGGPCNGDFGSLTKAGTCPQRSTTPANGHSRADALRAHGGTHDVASVVESRFGKRYIVEGKLVSPDGRNPLIRTVWIVEKPQAAPRLVTAYPLEESR